MSLRGKPRSRRPRGSVRELDAIVQAVAERYGVSANALRGRRQVKVLVEPRTLAIANAYATDRFSSVRLGDYFGGRHYATILVTVDRAERRGLL